MTFLVTQKPTPPTVFNLQASDWVHCEEETGAYYQLSRFTYKLVIVFYKFFKEKSESEKNTRVSKNSLQFIIQFFLKKEIIGYMYMLLNAMITSNLLYL